MVNLDALIPEPLSRLILKAGQEKLDNLEEIRLRMGQEAFLKAEGKLFPVKGIKMSAVILKEIVIRASRYSLYTVEQPLRNGWIPLAGGGRLGVAATVTTSGIREISSLCLRIEREFDCISENDFHSLYPGGFENTLILSPPGYGKTTLLRCMIKRLSMNGYNVGVADDRFEIASCRDGMPTYHLGNCVDIISGGKRSDTMLMLLRSMAPEIIACDEVVTKEDSESLRMIQNCGVRLLTTIHARNKNELEKRPYTLLDCDSFKTFITISMENGKRAYYTEKL